MVTKIGLTSEMSSSFFGVYTHMILDTLEEGQVWRNLQGGVLGVVKRIRSTDTMLDRAVVDFISLTGNHLTTTLSEMGLWQFHEEAAATYQPCRFSLCEMEAGYQYTREVLEEEPSVEAVCYHHIPRGVKSSKMAAPIAQSSRPHPMGDVQCGRCGEIGNEVIGEFDWSVVRSTSMWFCSTCNQSWIVARITDRECVDSNQYQVLESVVPAGYDPKSVNSYKDPVAAYTTFRIKIEPRPNTRVQGQKPATRYDLLRMGDD